MSSLQRRSEDRVFLVFFALLLGLSFFSCRAAAQADRATLTGTATDPTSAIISGVKMVARNSETGVTYSSETNESGIYAIPNLPIGTYSLSADREGFKTFQRDGLTLTIGQIARIDVQLAIGSSTETVLVTAAAPILSLQSEVGTNIAVDAMDDLPLSVNGGRGAQAFAYSVTPTVVGNEFDTHVGGSASYTDEVLIDGMSTDSGEVGVTHSGPPMEALAQFQIDATGASSEAGRTGGGAFMFDTKSGTNTLHGSAYLFYSNSSFNANTWDNNWWLAKYAGDPAAQSPYRKQPNTYDDFGLSLGGPVWLPKLYDGRNRTFFFFAYDKYQQASWYTDSVGGTVPTPAFLQGDFSGLLNTSYWGDNTPVTPGWTSCHLCDSKGNPIYRGAIFDPSTSTVIPNNIIPSEKISNISKNIVGLYQKYYQPTVPGKLTGNYPTLANAYPSVDSYNWSLKFDHAIGPNDHLSGDYSLNWWPRSQLAGDGGLFEVSDHNGGPLTTAIGQTLRGDYVFLTESHTFTPSVVNVISYVYNLLQVHNYPKTYDATNTNWTDAIGLGAYSNFKGMPHITFGNSVNGYGENPIGATDGESAYSDYNAVLRDSLSWQKGKNGIKFGAEVRGIGISTASVPNSLSYAYSSTDGIPANLLTEIGSFTGFGFANFLLGQVHSASSATSLNTYGRRKEYALYAQDYYKASSRLTLDGGLRWDFNRPLHEKFGHWTNFDLEAHDPSWGNLKGAEAWLTHPGNSFQKKIDYYDFSPHLSASYLLKTNLVLRAGYNLTYAPIGNNQWGSVPYSSQAAYGWTSINQVISASATAPAFQWDVNGYPGVLTPATGPVPDTNFMPVSPVSVDKHSLYAGRVHGWNAGVQYQVGSDTRFELNYIGNIGRKIHNGGLNPLNYAQWGTYQKLLMTGNAAKWISGPADAASYGVSYPFPGFHGYANWAIAPYPQVFEGWGQIVFADSPLGRSSYNALTFEVVKRKGKGLTLDLSYTFSKTEGNAESAFTDAWSTAWYQDPYAYNSHAGDPVSYDQRHLVKGYVVYILPIGTGRRVLGNASPLLNTIVGGWQISAFPGYGSGNPITAVGSTNSYPGWSAVYANVAKGTKFKNNFKRYNPAWDPSQGSNPDGLFMNPANFSDPVYGQLGNNNSRYFNNWQGWAFFNEDVGLLKNIQLSPESRFRLQLRGEFFDAFNRHRWAGPNLALDTPYFGQVQGVSGNRTGQLGFHMYW
jgi:hypothetical protein